MELTQRQERVLESIIEEFVKLAEPVSSKLLKRKHKFDISSATIRNEMKALTEAGYLEQPHTSAGRIPTDKSYRFFVNRLLGNKMKERIKVLKEFEKTKRKIEDNHRFIQVLTKNLAHLSSALTICYLEEEDFFFKEGWNEIFKSPEFKDFDYSFEFVNMLNVLEENFKDFFDKGEFQIYIGKEIPFSKSSDFSLIVSECDFPEAHKGFLAILGPKRMPYQRNISLLNSIVKLLEEKK